MSDYEPFEAAQGDPWSTEPVENYPHQKRIPESEPIQDDSQVLARVPRVDEEPAPGQYRSHGHSRSSHRGHRSRLQRAGIPAPVWVVVGMGLVALIATPFLISGKSGDETALDTPSWEAEMPAPDADLAPAWSSDNAEPQWQQPGPWPPQGATATVEPTTPGAWNTTGDLVGAPPNAPYAYNAGNQSTPTPNQWDAGPVGPNAIPDPSVAATTDITPQTGWAPGLPPAGPSSPIEPSYQTALGTTPQSGLPATPNQSASPWRDHSAGSSTMQSTPNGSGWGQSNQAPSLATPQPQNMMPGYGSQPTAQPNPYIQNPPHSASTQGPYAGTAPAVPTAPQQYPSYTPNYPVAGQPVADPYPTPNYPQTAMSPRPATPINTPPAVGTTPPAQSLTPPVSYPPAMGNSYPQAPVAAPIGQPGYGTGASNQTSQHSVARLNGTIQEPAVRQAYDDRTGHSYY